jgi:hypothetical protein
MAYTKQDVILVLEEVYDWVLDGNLATFYDLQKVNDFFKAYGRNHRTLADNIAPGLTALDSRFKRFEMTKLFQTIKQLKRGGQLLPEVMALIFPALLSLIDLCLYIKAQGKSALDTEDNKTQIALVEGQLSFFQRTLLSKISRLDTEKGNTSDQAVKCRSFVFARKTMYVNYIKKLIEVGKKYA